MNLFLEIRGRRPDGYHEIESVFQELDLADEVEVGFCGEGGARLECDAPGVPTGEGNLALRAAQRWQQRAGVNPGARITLRKRIPAGGGLGGASSDAAAVLRLLNRQADPGLDPDALADLAAELGSDVPFFLHGGTCLCRGRGERIEPVTGARGVPVVLILPEWGISTPAAYAALTQEDFGERDAVAITTALTGGTGQEVAEACFNRFEMAVERIEPRQGALRRRLEAAGFADVRMSGSGSTLYQVVRDGEAAEDLLDRALQCEGVREAVLAHGVGAKAS